MEVRDANGEVEMDIEGNDDGTFADLEENPSNLGGCAIHPLKYGTSDSWGWNVKDRSPKVTLSGSRSDIAHFHPNWSNGTAGVRGTKQLNGGRFYWEINVSQRIFGTSMMFGVGTKESRLHVDSFINMIGEDKHSWGLSHKGHIWHAGKSRNYTKPFRENVGTTVGIFFDGIKGDLTFYKDGVRLGVAFKNLHLVKQPLFPMVSSTAAKTEMALGTTKCGHDTLLNRCREEILKLVSNAADIEELEMPGTVKELIKQRLKEYQNDLELFQNNANP